MTTEPKQRPLDDDTKAALTLFNTYLEADRERQAAERALRKAEKAKDDAAAAVRRLNERKAPSERIAEAEQRYRDSLEALRRLQEGEAPADADVSDDAATSEADTQDEDAADGEDATDASDTGESDEYDEDDKGAPVA